MVSGLGSLRVLVSLPLAAVVVTLTVVPLRTSEAVFHFSVIDEVMTSYDGDTAVQFVEINMLLSGQNVVANTVLAAFDDSGSSAISSNTDSYGLPRRIELGFDDKPGRVTEWHIKREVCQSVGLMVASTTPDPDDACCGDEYSWFSSIALDQPKAALFQ